jgi:hypothetical protein
MMIARSTALATLLCFSSACSRVVVEERSPDGQYLASVAAHNTGATTSMMWFVTLKRTHFLASEATVFSAEHLDQPSIRWNGSKQLLIEVSVLNKDIGIHDTKWSDVSILYMSPTQGSDR